MSLRKRIVLTLVGITVILAIPAAYGLLALDDLHRTIHGLDEHGVDATDALGDLRNSVETLEDAHRRYLALSPFGRPVAPTDTLAVRARVETETAVDGMRLALAALKADTTYAAVLGPVEQQWPRIAAAMTRERDVFASGDRDMVDSARAETNDEFLRMEPALDGIEGAITGRTGRDLRRAERVALGAVTTTLTALALALTATLIIGALLTRTLLRPIGELRRGMATVAQGDFEPDVRVPDKRTDELGDLARSFETMTEQLRELDRLKAEFVSVASHEIKTPLSVIRGYVTLLADGIYGEVNEQQHKTLEAVSAQTDRLGRLVHRLLDVSRFEAGGARLELREIDLRAFFEDLTADFRVLATQNGIDFPVRLADDLPPTIVGDEDRLSEVLGNLLSNAFKFTDRGGAIRVDAARCDGGIQVEVEDTGVGIAADKLPRIFEKFYQVENDALPRQVGSGLGLAIAREIVEAHGGTIGAESQEGKGTRFHVFLPERPPVQERS
ncbi:MAG TPA: HAMP domain-containing sensor histidine kinase [Longimicrobium sp.]|nr:HAMP domain-containing sensor histidine kinase [Longimicrobium sp.]